jgi:regulator of sigma E protease
MNLLWYVGAFVLALGVLIVVHEFGHFIVARWCGVQVLRFSVGFGKPLLTKKWGKDGTEWVIAAVPLGGYVKMLDEREAPVPAQLLHRAFNRQSVYKRIAIVLAGPLANLLLATAIYSVVFQQGVTDLKPILASPVVGSFAERAGFQAGDTVKAIDGTEVKTWTDLRKTLLNAVLDERSMVVTVVTNSGGAALRQLDASAQNFDDGEGDPAEKLGLSPFRPKLAPVIGAVTADSPAGIAGIMPDDVVVSVNGDLVSEWGQIVALVRPAYGKPLIVEVERQGVRKSFTMVATKVAENGRPVGRLGIAVKSDPASYTAMLVEVRYGFVESIGRAVGEVWNTSALSLRMIGRMIVGEVSLKNLSGPVTIADYAGQSAKMGISPYLRFIALISISLGVLNLLPIPVLDGGHLMYYLAELFKGSPVSDSVQAIGQKIGFGILGLMMMFALYNDIHRLIAG